MSLSSLIQIKQNSIKTQQENRKIFFSIRSLIQVGPSRDRQIILPCLPIWYSQFIQLMRVYYKWSTMMIEGRKLAWVKIILLLSTECLVGHVIGGSCWATINNNDVTCRPSCCCCDRSSRSRNCFVFLLNAKRQLLIISHTAISGYFHDPVQVISPPQMDYVLVTLSGSINWAQ